MSPRNERGRKLRVRAMIGWLAPVALFALALPACSKETSPAAEAARSPNAEPVSAAAPAAEPATRPAAATAPAQGTAEPTAQAKVSGDNFELEMKPKGAYKAGQAGEAEILLVAKEPFHVNDQYPYKFKVKEGAGVKFGAPVVSKEAVKLEKQTATMLVGFTPEKAGKHVLAGQFSFSVCTDDKCLIEKRDLALEITAE